jgi:hypothetical protein
MKNNKKEITPEPYLANMTYDEDCWLIIDSSTSSTKDTSYVCFYNPKQDPTKEFETINEYAQAYFDDEFSSFNYPKIEHSEKSATAYGCDVSEDEDFDEASGRSCNVLVPNGQVIEVKTGIKLEDIKKEIFNVETTLDNLASNSKSEAKEAADEREDPYKARGLSRRDFC